MWYLMDMDEPRFWKAGVRLNGRSGEPVPDVVRIDLHLHSSVSDGDDPPELLVRRLADAGVCWAALTDHNDLAGQERFRRAAQEQGIHVVSGLEMDVQSSAGPLHLLAYGFDPGDQALVQTLRAVRRPRGAAARYWFGRGRALVNRGEARRPGHAASDVGAIGCRPPDAVGAIRLVHEAGGRAYLAHPLAVLPSVELVDELLDHLQPQGLDGLEVFHKPTPPAAQRELLAVAERRGLLVVAGSDYHGLRHLYGASPGVEIPAEGWSRCIAPLGFDRPVDLPPVGGEAVIATAGRPLEG
jgi:hypothetical protein